MAVAGVGGGGEVRVGGEGGRVPGVDHRGLGLAGPDSISFSFRQLRFRSSVTFPVD